MSIIDIHTHAFPNSISKKAMSYLQGLAKDCTPAGKGTVGDLLRSMDNTGVDISVICGIATKPGQWKGILSWLLEVESKHPERIIPLGLGAVEELLHVVPEVEAPLTGRADAGRQVSALTGLQPVAHPLH